MDFERMRRGAEQPGTATRAQLPAVADDLAAAFRDDPMFDWFSRPDARRDAARARFFRFLLRRVVFGVGEVLRPESGGAAAVWMPSEAMDQGGLWRELIGLPVLLGLTGWSRFARLASLREAVDRNHPAAPPHDYLFFLGVTPSAQGHGVGSRLLRSRTDHLDAIGRPAFLETATEANVRLYRRHGFEVLSVFRPQRDGPENWAMWREPQSLS